MILLVDVGNTRVKWRCFGKDGLFDGGQLVHDGYLSSAELHEVWDSIGIPSSVLCVNVGGAQIAEMLSQWSVSQWGIACDFVMASKHLGNVTNGYHEPERLGADRWMALIGAARIRQGACCIADCGTAVTIDGLNSRHEHIGGLILPGLTMMPQCVSRNTAEVSLGTGTAALFGRDTASCLASGALQSITATLERMAGIMEKELASPVNRIITGGDAPHILPLLSKDWHYEPDLIFHGLIATIECHKG